MKLSVVLFVVLVAYVCANDKEKAQKKHQEIVEKCLKESGTTVGELQKCQEEKKQCPKMNCFEACSLREDGMLNKDGTVNTKLIEHVVAGLAKHGHPKRSAAVKKCFQNPKKQISFCDTAHAINVCMQKEPDD